jgi:hypothetical protein
MLAWQVWIQSKGLQVLPSQLYDIENRLAAFYFNRGIYLWGTLVENKMAEAESKVRKSFRNKKGAEVFINSERTKIYNKLLGIDSTKGVYRSAGGPQLDSDLFKG